MQTEAKRIAELQRKADLWDKLDKEIRKFYLDENDDEIIESEAPGDLCDIGEIASSAFGYL